MISSFKRHKFSSLSDNLGQEEVIKEELPFLLLLQAPFSMLVWHLGTVNPVAAAFTGPIPSCRLFMSNYQYTI